MKKNETINEFLDNLDTERGAEYQLQKMDEMGVSPKPRFDFIKISELDESGKQIHSYCAECAKCKNLGACVQAEAEALTYNYDESEENEDNDYESDDEGAYDQFSDFKCSILISAAEIVRKKYPASEVVVTFDGQNISNKIIDPDLYELEQKHDMPGAFGEDTATESEYAALYSIRPCKTIQNVIDQIAPGSAQR